MDAPANIKIGIQNVQGRKMNNLYQFYTRVEVSEELIKKIISIVPEQNRKIFLEPSAGNGSFSNILNKFGKCIAFDVEPKCNSIVKSDFFNISNIYEERDSVCVVGNPPFGKNSSLAVKFFNHATKFGNYICFILPKTFKKVSIHNRLDINFHLICNIELDKNSFIFNNKYYNVPCVFQIWKKEGIKREKKLFKESNLFKFTTKDNADMAIRRVGGRSGKVFMDFEKCNINSNYFIKVKYPYDVGKIFDLINLINFKEISSFTAGVRSISKIELVEIIERSYFGS